MSSPARRPASATLPPDNNSLAAERLRGIVLSHRDWLFADGARIRLRAQWRELFKSFDVVICPVMPTPAYPRVVRRFRRSGISTSTAARMLPMSTSWPGPASPRCPACRQPQSRSGFRRKACRSACQIVGPWLEDRTPLKLAELIEREFGGFVPPPMFDD